MTRPPDARDFRSPEVWARIEPLLDRCLDLEGEARSALLEEIGARDPGLRGEIDRLLRADEATRGPLDLALGERAPALLRAALEEAEAPAPRVPGQVGPFRLVREIGRGGMGTVWLGERTDGGFRQQVAVKLLRGTPDNEEILARFQRERQILAMLRHPGIARLIDGGATPEGSPWFAMELVDGEPILEYAAGRRLGLEERLRLFLQTLHAVQSAHQNLIVHRDLKPANILVNSSGEVKLLDFGIARLMDPEGGGGAPTMALMTPRYAAPEQIRGEPPGTSTDLYSLGVVLYELMTGRSPHGDEDRPAWEVSRAILEEAPVAPSLAAQRAGPEAGLPEEPGRWARQLAGDLDNIILLALRKEPARRYTSVEALAADIDRYLSGEPVSARPATWRYRAGKFVRRNRPAVLLGVVGLVALVTGLIATAWQARVATRERDRARVEAERARQLAEFATGLFRSADPNEAPGESLQVRTVLRQAAGRIRQELAGQPEMQVTMLKTVSQAYAGLGLYGPARAIGAEALALARGALGPRHESVADMLNLLGQHHMESQSLDSARVLLSEARRLHEDLYGPGSVKTAAVLANLGSLAYARAEYAAAESLYRRVIDIDLKAYGPEHLELARDLNNFGIELTEYMDRPAEGESLLARALDIRVRQLGSEHPLTILTEENLGRAFEKLDRLPDAERCYRRTLEVRRRLLGREHPDVALSLNSLAGLLGRQGRLAEAESLFVEAAALSMKLQGARSLDTGRTLNNLAIVRYRQGHYAEAANTFQQCVEIFSEVLGPDQAGTLSATLNLGAALRESGRLAEAEPVILKALNGNRRLHGEESPAAALAHLHLGRLYRRTGRTAASEEELTTALRIFRAALGPTHSRVGESLEALGALYLQTGRLAEGRTACEEALAVALKSVGPDNPQTADALVTLGRLRLELHQPARAESALAAARQIRSRTYGERDPRTVEVRQLLAARR